MKLALSCTLDAVFRKLNKLLWRILVFVFPLYNWLAVTDDNPSASYGVRCFAEFSASSPGGHPIGLGWWNIVRLVAPWCFLSAMSVTHVPWWRSGGFWLCRNSGLSFICLSFHTDRDSTLLCHRDVCISIDVRIEIRVDHSSHPILINCQNEQLVYKNWNRNWS